MSRLLASGFAFMGLLPAGCLDLSPIEPGTVDASVALGDASKATPCLACFLEERDTGESCAEAMLDCEGKPPCMQIVQCMMNTGCFDGYGHEAANRCAVPCVLGAGVLSPVDPGLIQAVAVSGCSYEKCPAVCFRDPPDAGNSAP